MMEAIKTIASDFAWSANVIGLFLVIATKIFSNTKAAWGGIGVILLIIALGNAVLFLSAGLNPAFQLASLFSVVVLGSLGARFIGNWLTDGAV